MLEKDLAKLAEYKNDFDKSYAELISNCDLSAINNLVVACYRFIDALSPITHDSSMDSEHNRFFGIVDKE